MRNIDELYAVRNAVLIVAVDTALSTTIGTELSAVVDAKLSAAAKAIPGSQWIQYSRILCCHAANAIESSQPLVNFSTVVSERMDMCRHDGGCDNCVLSTVDLLRVATLFGSN